MEGRECRRYIKCYLGKELGLVSFLGQYGQKVIWSIGNIAV